VSLVYNTIRSEVLHKRIRVYIQSIYKNQEKALEIERLSSGITGVKYCKANPSTGNLLIVYDNETTDEHLIKRQIYRFISKKLLSSLPTDMETVNS
jgi:Ca2+-transporting ATPase